MAAVDLDRLAWRAICEWPHHSAIEVVQDGLDYGVLTRCFLWDKVPRAVRARQDPAAFEFEKTLISQQQKAPVASSYPVWKQRIKQPLQRFRQLKTITGLQLSHLFRQEPVLFIPRQHSHLRSTLAALSRHQTIRLIGPVDHGPHPGVTCFRADKIRPANLEFSEQLHAAIISGLEQLGIQLMSADSLKLKQQILHQAQLIKQIEAEFVIAKPDALLTFTDNHTPSQEYVAVANRQGLPTIMLQHGLDCEQYCLNDAYATVVAVWGNARKQRYQTLSEHQPTLIRTTGNPEYDHCRRPLQLCPSGDHWLWATRPHRPEKCYLPSRRPQEGLAILKALLTALQQTETAHLVIKPHPMDYIDLYAAHIEEAQMSDRVTLSHLPLSTALPKSNIVISEDSTAALEAMFLGKILIHAHFAASPPVLPLSDYAAALPASDPTELQQSLKIARHFTREAQQKMFLGQKNFISDYAGDLDGKACERVTALISQVMNRKD